MGNPSESPRVLLPRGEPLNLLRLQRHTGPVSLGGHVVLARPLALVVGYPCASGMLVLTRAHLVLAHAIAPVGHALVTIDRRPHVVAIIEVALAHLVLALALGTSLLIYLRTYLLACLLTRLLAYLLTYLLGLLLLCVARPPAVVDVPAATAAALLCLCCSCLLSLLLLLPCCIPTQRPERIT